MYDRTYVTLNISSSSIRLLSVKGRQVKQWGSMPLPRGLVKDGLILRPKVVGAVISALFKSTEIPRKRAITSLTGLSFIYRILSLPRVATSARQEAIQRAASKEMPLPLEELYLSWQIIDERQDELDCFLLGVPRNPIDALVQTLGEAGVTPYLMDLKPLALARAANREDAIIVALEPDCFDIVIVTNGMPAIMHAITPAGEQAVIEDNIRRLSDGLAKTVEFHNTNHPQNPISRDMPLLLTGELSADTATSELIMAEIGYPVEFLEPPLQLPRDLPAALFASNIGLALKKLPLKPATEGDRILFRDINLNIFAEKYKPATYWFKLSYILMFLAAIIGLSLLFPLNNMRSQAGIETTRLQAEFTSVSQQLDQRLLSVDKAEQIEDTIDKMVADAEEVKQGHQHILSKGGDFANNMKLVTSALPSGAYFTSAEIGTTQIAVEGKADSPFTVVSYVMALEALEKFSEVRITRIDGSNITEDGTAEVESSGVSFGIIITR